MAGDAAGRVHVLGNAGIDIMLRVPRAPRDGETLIARSASRAPGGKGLNQAVVAARAGAAVRFEAPVGEDADAAFVRGALAGEGIAALRLRTVPLPTDMSVVIVDDAGENRIVSTSACADAVTTSDAAAFASDLRGGDVLLMQGNLSHGAAAAAANAAAGRGARVVLNLAPYRWPPSGLLTLCHLVVNRLEASQASGTDDPTDAARRLCRAGAPMTIVTLGDQGCLVAEGETCRVFPARRVTAVDTTGAGDTFCGMLAAGLARGRDIADAVRAAQAAAAMTVIRPGAFDALPTLKELAGLLA